MSKIFYCPLLLFTAFTALGRLLLSAERRNLNAQAFASPQIRSFPDRRRNPLRERSSSGAFLEKAFQKPGQKTGQKPKSRNSDELLIIRAFPLMSIPFLNPLGITVQFLIAVG
ncbi:MAG: hypothetical protein KIT57_17910 [Blastocatellales bacterium]|nr:hypothetical protein [Blastocatellales bacterium]